MVFTDTALAIEEAEYLADITNVNYVIALSNSDDLVVVPESDAGDMRLIERFRPCDRRISLTKYK